MNLGAVLFDAYGTLLDVHASVARHRARLGDAATAVSVLWRQKQLEYTWTLTLAGDYQPFDLLTARALDFALAQHGVTDAALRIDLLDAYSVLDAYPDVAATLQKLRARKLTVGVLSNGTGAMLREAFAAAGLDRQLDPLLSVEGLQLYKPDPRVYRMACERLDLPPNRIGFVSSNAWDAMGAARFGFQVFWLRRQIGPVEYDLPRVARQIPTLDLLAEQIA
ncbi:2-haloacid dehalogenase [Dongia mobilis]|uniref:(S)-2-haloacid dehalogenase n=1 Tax=Dongia mobilis TaxID=578943 RepID=A0A4R6WVF2_9PROT|nr:haloacid dehalogenase type II [Dongia mobilis]TDQ84419.1 2-haloacid dehalogenase [Dongia mobilis]